MSINQPEKRTRGRPPKAELYAIPTEMAQELGSIGFFDPSLQRWALWPNLPNMDKYGLTYRLRAAMQRALQKVDRGTMEIVTGRSWKQLGRYLQGDDAPAAIFDAVAVAAELPSSWIMTGDSGRAVDHIRNVVQDDEKMRGKRAEFFGKNASDLRKSELLENMRQHIENIVENKLGGDISGIDDIFRVADEYPIARHQLTASAGNGDKIFDEPPASIWRVPKGMLRNFNGNPANLASIDVKGDSMEPTLADGEPIIFDRSSARFDRDAVYVITIADELFVKRVRRVPTAGGMMTLSLISDNPAYPEVTLDPETQERVRIIGRVVWPNTSRRL